jgi:hypothetical protein
MAAELIAISERARLGELAAFYWITVAPNQDILCGKAGKWKDAADDASSASRCWAKCLRNAGQAAGNPLGGGRIMSTLHTPGPWRRVGHRTIAAGTGPDRKTICELYSWGDCSEADGNEALIEAAPELHQAAAEVFGFIDAGFLTVGILAEDNLDRVAACGRAIDALAAALAKVSKGRP